MINIVCSNDISLPATAEQWLMELQEATAIEIPGRSSEWRVITTLIHGNEPSGFYATYEFLKQGIVPETNLAIVIVSVRAARHQGLFIHRFIPGEYDLNRRFGVSDAQDHVTRLARNLREYIASRSPQFVLDLHNTSGQSPSFAVSVSDHPSILKLASIFTQHLIITHLVVGSLMEQNFNCPIVTIECGGAGDHKAHEHAFNGICSIASIDDVSNLNEDKMETCYHPVRVELKPGRSLEFSDSPLPDIDITLQQHIEDLNTQALLKGASIGWINGPVDDILTAKDNEGKEFIADMFLNNEGRIVARKPLKVYMATQNRDIAISDCLFYVIDVEILHKKSLSTKQ